MGLMSRLFTIRLNQIISEFDGLPKFPSENLVNIYMGSFWRKLYELYMCIAGNCKANSKVMSIIINFSMSK